MQHPTSGDETRVLKLPNLYPRSIWVRLAIVLGLAVLCIVPFVFFVKVDPVNALLISIPVAMAGWYFGINAGLIASFLGVALSAFLLANFNGRDWLTWIVIGWPGNLIVIGAGYITGRLHKEFFVRTQIVEELRSRDRYVTLINMTIGDILNPKNIDDRYPYLVTHLVNLFVADYAYLVRWDATREQAILIASTLPSEKPASDILLEPVESELASSVLRTRRVLVIEDVPNSRHIITPSLFKNSSLSPQSALCIPLIVGDQKLGAAIIVYDTPHHFNAEELTYAEFAADQFALALWTIQQEFEIQKQLKVANTLVNIERALSETERVGIRTVLQFIVDSACELIPGAENAVLHLLDGDQQILVPRAVSGEEGKSKTRLDMRLGEGAAGQAIATGAVIGVSDTLNDPRFINRAAVGKYRSLVVAPIQSNEQAFGSISVYSERPNTFTSDAGNLLRTLGTQAAIAIENANLLETTRQDLREIDALYHISRGLATSLDPDQLMKEVVNLLKQDFGYYHAQIYVMDPESRDFLIQRGSGKIGDQLLEQGYRLPAGAGIVGHVAETEQPFVTNNVEDVVFFVRNPLLPETQSELAVPIKIENEVVGVLDIQHVRPGHLTQRDLQLMTTVADQLAVALQKANLYADLQTSLNQEKAMRLQLIQSERLAVVGRLLASVSHELNNPLQAIQNALFLIKEEERLSPQGSQDLEIILSETEQLSILLERLRTTFHPTRTEDFEDVELNPIVENIISLTATHMRHREISLQFFPDPDLPTVPAISGQIRQVVLNLFMNAVEAMQPGGNLSVQTQFIPNEDKILLCVSDTGSGIAPEVMPHIFEPFFTNKETGTGLGLTITSDIIRQHNGTISAENNPGGGATFKVWLPVHKKS
jgi:signal transduction histidine kinase